MAKDKDKGKSDKSDKSDKASKKKDKADVTHTRTEITDENGNVIEVQTTNTVKGNAKVGQQTGINMSDFWK